MKITYIILALRYGLPREMTNMDIGKYKMLKKWLCIKDMVCVDWP